MILVMTNYPCLKVGHHKESLRKCIVELEEENSRLKGSVDDSIETITVLRCSVDAEIEEYNLLMDGNKSLRTEHDTLHEHCEDLGSELAKVHASAVEDVATLEASIKSTVAHPMNVAVVGVKHLSNF
jgi:FtsZ-binding cell division protein ZapB